MDDDRQRRFARQGGESVKGVELAFMRRMIVVKIEAGFADADDARLLRPLADLREQRSQMK